MPAWLRDGSAGRYHTAYLLDVCWSPVKPAVFFTARSDGVLDVWDFLFHQKEPSLSLKVGPQHLWDPRSTPRAECHHPPVPCPQMSNDPLLSVRSQDNGQIVGCGTKTGSVSLLEISPGLCTLRKNEKTLTSTVRVRSHPSPTLCLQPCAVPRHITGSPVPP